MTACPDETQLALLVEGALADLDRVEHHHDAGESGDQLYLALELVTGTTARAWRSSARSSAEILALWRQVGAGLLAVHRARPAR